MNKTYAVKVKDYLGTIYTVGYVIANGKEEATTKAKTNHPQSYVVAADGDAEQDAINRLLDDANHETHHQMRGERRKRTPRSVGKFYVWDSGGNCQCLRRDFSDGRHFLVTDDGGSELPTKGQPALIGYYDAEDQPIGNGARLITWDLDRP